MLRIKQFVFNHFEENTYLVYDTESLEAIVVDPGMLFPAEYEEFDKFLTDNKLTLTQIVNTHLHLDHCFGANYVRTRYGAKLAANSGDAFLGKSMPEQAKRFGIHSPSPQPVEIDVELKEGDKITVGKYEIDVLHVPGHSPGSIVLYCPAGPFIIAGDVLFRGSIGRTDLEGGNHAELIGGIRKKLFTLPAETRVLPGHGPHTTIGEEIRSNPYVR